jgi:hypothetical protein
MGVLGEYIGRVYDEVRQRPLSIINKVYYPSTAGALENQPEYEEEEKPARILRIA